MTSPDKKILLDAAMWEKLAREAEARIKELELEISVVSGFLSPLEGKGWKKLARYRKALETIAENDAAYEKPFLIARRTLEEDENE